MLGLNKKLFLVLVLFSIGYQSLAQNTHKLMLSDYTISKRQKINVVWAGEEIKSMQIKGADARFIKSAGTSQLEVKPTGGKMFYQFEIEALSTSGKKSHQKFTVVKDDFISNKVIAHRGAWKNVPTTENSLAALKHAIDLKCEGSEFDVYLSADTILYIHHDPSLKTMVIEETSSQILSQQRLENGEVLPTLSSYLMAGKIQNQTKLILEIKPSKGEMQRKELIVRKVLDLVAQTQTQAWVEYISFDYDMCKMLVQKNPFAKVAYLNGDKSPSELQKDKLTGLDYHLKVLQQHPEWIKEAHDLGLSVNVWTVNDESVMDWMLQHQVNFITTNEPELLLKKVKRK